MTLKELSQLYWLAREIKSDQERLDALSRLARQPSSPSLSGMPRAPYAGNDGKVARLAAEIVDLQAVITAKQIQCVHEQARLERWINDIEDVQTRLVFRFRFIDCLPWAGVADRIGGGNTEDSVKKRCYRFLRDCGGADVF